MFSFRPLGQSRLAVASVAAAGLVCLVAAVPSQAAKLYVVLSDPGGFPTSGPVVRYDVRGPARPATVDATISDPTFDLPCCLALSRSGELFVVNRGDGLSPGAGSITRITSPQRTPVSNGVIASASFGGPHWAVFRRGELFVAQRGASNVLSFRFDRAGHASPSGAITEGLCCIAPRGVAVSRSGELFVSQCCGVNTINRYLFDSAGTPIPHGQISGGGLANPHDLAFSRSGELFVANADADSISRFRFDRAGNATAVGQISGPSLSSPIGLDFSPWGELFVTNHEPPGAVSRWLFSRSGAARFNGSFPTANTAIDLQFGPCPENKQHHHPHARCNREDAAN
jgi:hypothetical protein